MWYDIIFIAPLIMICCCSAYWSIDVSIDYISAIVACVFSVIYVIAAISHQPWAINLLIILIGSIIGDLWALAEARNDMV